MACATTYGSAIQFGIPSEELGLATQEVSVKLKADRKEARNGCGDVVSVTWYNKQNEVDITGHGTLGGSNDNIADVITLANTIFSAILIGTIYTDEVNYTLNNEGYITVNVKGVAFDLVPS